MDLNALLELGSDVLVWAIVVVPAIAGAVEALRKAVPALEVAAAKTAGKGDDNAVQVLSRGLDATAAALAWLERALARLSVFHRSRKKR